MTDSASSWSCTDVLSHIYEFLDGELGAGADERVRAHFSSCGRCRVAFEHERVFLRVVAERSRLEACPAELRRRIIESFKAERDDA
jgi:anti-sigma factor (TIGR02949 family)